MGFTKVILSRGVTINIGDFQNAKAEMLVEYMIRPGESIEEARAAASRAVREGLLAEIEPTLQTVSNWRAEHFRSLLGQPEEPWEPPLPSGDAGDWADASDDDLDDGFQTHSDDESDESEDIPEDVIEGLTVVRESARTNMLDFDGVVFGLIEENFHSAADWLEDNRGRFLDALEVMGKRTLE
jgi:hypothetical protein